MTSYSLCHAQSRRQRRRRRLLLLRLSVRPLFAPLPSPPPLPAAAAYLRAQPLPAALAQPRLSPRARARLALLPLCSRRLRFRRASPRHRSWLGHPFSARRGAARARARARARAGRARSAAFRRRGRGCARSRRDIFVAVRPAVPPDCVAAGLLAAVRRGDGARLLRRDVPSPVHLAGSRCSLPASSSSRAASRPARPGRHRSGRQLYRVPAPARDGGERCCGAPPPRPSRCARLRPGCPAPDWVLPARAAARAQPPPRRAPLRAPPGADTSEARQLSFSSCLSSPYHLDFGDTMLATMQFLRLPPCRILIYFYHHDTTSSCYTRILYLYLRCVMPHTHTVLPVRRCGSAACMHDAARICTGPGGFPPAHLPLREAPSCTCRYSPREASAR